MTTVFLSGSRKIARLNDVIRLRLQNIVGQGLSVIVGDANGADKAMQAYLMAKQYRDVAVYFAGDVCRNNLGDWRADQIAINPKLKGRARHTQKDRAMAAQADYGLILWDGKSVGSLTNVCELLTLGKTSAVYFAPKRAFVTVATGDDIEALLGLCERSDVTGFESAPLLNRKMESLGISTQRSLDL